MLSSIITYSVIAALGIIELTASEPLSRISNDCTDMRSFSDDCFRCGCNNGVFKCEQFSCYDNEFDQERSEEMLSSLSDLIPRTDITRKSEDLVIQHRFHNDNDWWNAKYGNYWSNWLKNSAIREKANDYSAANYEYFKHPMAITRIQYGDDPQGLDILEDTRRFDSVGASAQLFQGLRCKGMLVGYNSAACELCYCHNNGGIRCYTVPCDSVPRESLPQCVGDGKFEIGCQICSCWYGRVVCDKRLCGLYTGPLQYKPQPIAPDLSGISGMLKPYNWCDGDMTWYEDIPRCSRCSCERGEVTCFRDTCYASLRNLDSCAGQGRMRRGCSTCKCRRGVLDCSRRSSSCS